MDGSRSVVRSWKADRVGNCSRPHAFVDSTGYGHLAAYSGAKYTEPNDYAVANSIGVAGIDLDKVWNTSRPTAGRQPGLRPARRCAGQDRAAGWPPARGKMGVLMTTVHDDYFMFVKFNVKMPVSPTDRDATAKAELQLRKQQSQWIQKARKSIPGCEKAFIARTSPTLCIRRGRLITCDYDITSPDVLEGRHFDDDIMAYGFHDMAPRLQVKNGGTYGIPYKALRVAGGSRTSWLSA